jgi:hypothetical protein
LGVSHAGDAQLAQVTGATGLASFLTGAGKHGEQNRRQNGDYRYHHEQFNEREASPNDRFV